MNAHHPYPYSDISSPHPPSPDNNNYAPPMSIGAHHINGHANVMNSMAGQQQGFHQINNNNAMMNKCAGCGSKYHIDNQNTFSIWFRIHLRYHFINYIIYYNAVVAHKNVECPMDIL